MIGLILGLVAAFVGVITGIGGALLGVLAALGGVLLGLAVPFAPLLVIVGLLVFLVAGQKRVNQAPQSPDRR
jgi:hypothetical protein